MFDKASELRDTVSVAFLNDVRTECCEMYQYFTAICAGYLKHLYGLPTS
jgi:hypothetical protein